MLILLFRHCVFSRCSFTTKLHIIHLISHIKNLLCLIKPEPECEVPNAAVKPSVSQIKHIGLLFFFFLLLFLLQLNWSNLFSANPSDKRSRVEAPLAPDETAVRKKKKKYIHQSGCLVELHSFLQCSDEVFHPHNNVQTGVRSGNKQ